jgi:putative oxidoreductase
MLGARMDSRQVSMGLFLLRLGAGGLMIYGHALSKMLLIRDLPIVFPDPFGIGDGRSWGVIVFAEFVCSAFVMLGIATRYSAVPPLLVMLVSALSLPSGALWSAREIYFLYALPFFVLTFTGGGDYSVDELFLGGKSGRR